MLGASHNNVVYHLYVDHIQSLLQLLRNLTISITLLRTTARMVVTQQYGGSILKWL